MDLSKSILIATNLIKKKEGFKENIGNGKVRAYADPVGIPTIGWGNTYHLNGAKVKFGDVITIAQAEQLLAFNIGKFASEVIKFLKVPVSDEQLAGLTSFSYTSGIGTPGGTKGLVNKDFFKVFNSGDSTAAAALLERTNLTGRGNPAILPGLVIRRKEEAALLRQKKNSYSTDFVGWAVFGSNIRNLFTFKK